MQVILLKDVAKIGRRHEIKNVADGYGRNFLLARQLAVLASPENRRKLEQWKRQESGQDQLQQGLLDKALTQLAGLSVIIQAKASPEGHLFAGIHQADIVAALSEQHHFQVPASAIELDQAIKTVGEHQLEIKVGQVSGRFMLKIEALKK